MSTSYTANLKLAKPGPGDRGWATLRDGNVDKLDALSPVGGLCVTANEVPSVTLLARVAAGKFQKADGTAGQTSVLYLDGSGNLTSGTAYPATSHIRLGTVVAGSTSITSVSDDRVVCVVLGTDSQPFLPLAGGTLADGASVVVGTGTGTMIATASAQKLGFWGATPIARPTPFTQTYSTADHTINAYTSNPQGSAYTGIASGVGGTPYAQLTDVNNLRVAYENLRAFAEDVAQALNALIDDLQSTGLSG
jgi:hypothetical protein